MHPAALPPDDLLEQCLVRHDRRSGPGGQHRNKVETAVVIQHTPTGVIAEASERRSQRDNKRAALFRLRLALAMQVRTPDELPSENSALWQTRKSGTRIQVSPSHDDYPALLAEVNDRLVQHDFDLPATAAVLGVSGSQVAKFLRSYPPALLWLNRHRSERGLSKLT